MALTLTEADLSPFAEIESDKAQAMIDDALALAKSAAPCLKDDDLDSDTAAAAKAVLRGAILRWNDSGTGVVTQQVAGPFQQTVDTTHARRSLFWPSEIEALQKLCRDLRGTSGAWDYDTISSDMKIHTEGCDVYFGLGCNCRAEYGDILPWFDNA